MSLDLYGRSIDYLRVSVTDRCNFRCVYCMPSEGVKFQQHEQILRYEEIISVVKAAVDYGITKVRVTGGEPLVRFGIVDFIAMLKEIQQIKDISMTTNGYLLEKYAAPLKAAGLNRVNISLDTLNPTLFSKITRGGDFQQVWNGILAAETVGMDPIKINLVAIKGLNDHEIIDFAKLSINHPWHVRFIELMPVKNQVPWGDGFPNAEDGYISTTEMIKKFEGMNLTPVESWIGNGPARIYQLAEARGYIGFISPLEEEHFCRRCNSMRLTADGNLRPCLMSDEEIPLLPVLRAGGDIKELFARAIHQKPKKHDLLNNHQPKNRSMMQIGG